AGDEAASGVRFRSFFVIPGHRAAMSPESIGPVSRGEMDSGFVLRTPGNDDVKVGRALPHGGGTLVIGLRCASAATVDVPIGPFSSYNQHSPIAMPSLAWWLTTSKPIQRDTGR